MALIGALEAARSVPQAWRELPVGKALRRLREELGLHQWALACRIGMRQSMVSRIERGADLRVSTLRRLLEAMGCELIVLPATVRGIEGLRALSRLQELQRREEGRRALAELLRKTKD